MLSFFLYHICSHLLTKSSMIPELQVKKHVSGLIVGVAEKTWWDVFPRLPSHALLMFFLHAELPTSLTGNLKSHPIWSTLKARDAYCFWRVRWKWSWLRELPTNKVCSLCFHIVPSQWWRKHISICRGELTLVESTRH